MLNTDQYNRLKPYRDIIIYVGEGKGNTSKGEIGALCNQIWMELGHAPKNTYCSHCIYELFQNIKDEIKLYEEKYS